MNVSEMLQKMYKNDLFDTRSEFSKVMYILAVIAAVWCPVERSFSAMSRLKTRLPLQHHGTTAR